MREHLTFFHQKFWENFDKILLAVLFFCVLLLTLYITIKPGMDEGALDWARSTANLILGGLLGLITGKYLADKKNGEPPTP